MPGLRQETAPVGPDGMPSMAPGVLLEVYGRQVDELALSAESVRAGATVIAAALRELRAVLDEVASRLGTAAPTRECLECWVRFAWDESPDENRCAACAEVHEWNHQGGAVVDLDLDHTAGASPVAARSATCWTGSSS